MQKKIFQDGHTEGVYVCVFGDMCGGGQMWEEKALLSFLVLKVFWIPLGVGWWH